MNKMGIIAYPQSGRLALENQRIVFHHLRALESSFELSQKLVLHKNNKLKRPFNGLLINKIEEIH